MLGAALRIPVTLVVPGNASRERLDRPVTIEQAAAMCRRLAAEGLFVGPSSGAYEHAALEIAAGGRFGTLVTVLSDTGDRYASTGMWPRE